MDSEQLAALGRVINSKHYSARRDVCVLMASPSDIEALSRPIAPSIDTRALAEELFAITSGAASIEEIKLLRKKRDQALVSIGDLWQSLRDANEEIHRLQIASSEPQSQEQIAEIVHNAIRFEREEVPAWQAGNSHAENRARQAAREIAALLQAAGGPAAAPTASDAAGTERVQIELPPTPESSVARVTLELTGRFDCPPSEWPWEAIFAHDVRVQLEPGDSVRVVDEFRPEWVSLDMGIDATLAWTPNYAPTAVEGFPVLPVPDMAPLGSAQPATGWLKPYERSLLVWLADDCEMRSRLLDSPGTKGSGLPKSEDLRSLAATLRNFLARSTPPEVVMPVCQFTPDSTHAMGWWEALGKVKKSLAAAGVPWKEAG